MKNILVKIFWPILRFFETGEVAPNYKKSHRVALNVMGALFIFLSLVSAGATSATGDLGSLLPVVVFALVGVVALVVGTLGSNGAVCKIWGTKSGT
ncbi:MAG: hypothetical protein V7708_04595 [Oceanicoccus sp.]